MSKYFTLILCFLFPVCLTAQQVEVINNQAIHFQLADKKDPIDFIVIDTVLNQKKPILLFCQGSMPMPLFIDYGPDKGLFMAGGGVSNFDISKIQKYYHLVVISKPETPFIVKSSNINKDYSYITDSTNKISFKKEFLLGDYVENYVNRANKVISYLRKQPWVDKNKLVVFGHSQGGHIAPGIAVKNKHVTHLGLAGANLFGRISVMILKERKRAETGKITWEVAEKNMNEWYQFWKEANNAEIVKTKPQLISWKSFSEPPAYKTLLKINIPIYLTYGTSDISDMSDLMPLIFISHEKNNLTLKRYFGLEHNFFEVDENGVPNYEKDHWKEVMNGFIDWTLTAKP